MQRGDQATRDDKTGNREKQIDAPPGLAQGMDRLQQWDLPGEQAVLQVMKQHPEHGDAAQQFDVHDPLVTHPALPGVTSPAMGLRAMITWLLGMNWSSTCLMANPSGCISKSCQVRAQPSIRGG